MSLVTLAQLRFLWRARGSLFSALLGMSIGVASVVGVHLLSAQVASSVAQQERPVGDVDLYLQQTLLTENDYFALRARWRAGELPQVAALFPLLEGEVSVADETYFLVGTDPLANLEFGASSTENAVGSAVSGMSRLTQLLLADSVVMPRRTTRGAEGLVAEKLKLSGHEVRVLGYTAPERIILADLPTARSVLEQAPATYSDPLRLTRIGVRLAPAAQPTGLGESVRLVAGNLFPGVFAQPTAQPLPALGKQWQQISANEQNPAQQLFRSVLFNVAALSVLALVVAWLLTYQVACHALGRRLQMFERLQSLGVSRRRLWGLTQTEGLVLGLIATLVGVIVGLVLANMLLSLALGQSFELALGVSKYAWIKAAVSGVGVAGFSYWLAARQTLFQSTASTNALKPEANFGAVRRGLFALVLVCVFCWGLWGDTLVGAFGCIVVSALALIVYLPTFISWLWRRSLTKAKKFAAISQQKSSTLRKLGIRQVLVGQELRLGVSALALALATALGISIMVDSFRVAFLQMLDQRLADDVVVRVKADAPDSTASTLQTQLSTIVEAMFWRGTRDVSIRGVAGRIEFADDTTQLLERFLSEDLLAKSVLTQDARNQGAKTNSISESSPAATMPVVYLNESFARSQKLAAGTPITLTGSRASIEVFIAGVFSDFGEVRPRFLATRELVRQLHFSAPLSELYLRVPEGVSVRDSVQALLANSTISVQDQVEVRRRSIEAFEQTFAITRALTWLALLVAAVALANALLAHGLQQQGTTHQLRVLGLSGKGQRQLRRARAFYVTGAAIALAIPLGLLIAWLLCTLVNPRAYGWSFPLKLGFAGVGWPLIGGAVGGLVAVTLGDAWVRRQPAHVSAPTLAPIAVAFLLLWLQGCSGESSSNTGSAHTLTGTHPHPHPHPHPQGSAHQTATAEPSLRVGSLLGGEATGFARATKVVPFEFPRDHGAHPQFRSEWWYLTCPLRSAATSSQERSEYGIQFTLFRQALAPAAEIETDNPWRTGQVFMAHAALTDVAAGRHFEASRLARGHPALAGVRVAAQGAADEKPFALWLEDWRLESVAAVETTKPDTTGAGLNELKLRVRTDAFRLDLALVAEKPLVLQGDRGLSYKGSREASYYYSLPRLSAQGSVETTDKPTPVVVAGACWLDREWSTSVLAKDLVGWDWFALQFDGGEEMMLFQLRDASDAEPAPGKNTLLLEQNLLRQGKRISRDGTATVLAGAELDFAPVRFWQDETGVHWPVEWHIRTPSKQLRVVAALDDQKMRSSIEYWEGLVWIYEEDLRVGQGYLEMTGYAKNATAASGASGQEQNHKGVKHSG